ncbi:MAG: M48 family metalloprotease [Gammaproteobacteria bacterium]|nr:M48 family metalloprotease [Gammaproteobacteria bacterium]
MLKRFFTSLSLAALLFSGVISNPLYGQSELPQLGTAGGGSISLTQEYELGKQIVNQIRKADGIFYDPLLNEYIHSLGYQLASVNNSDGQPFGFFIVKDNRVNAFALPGGFIGVNIGMILRTEKESELAGVMAHEVAHVTQRHIARRFEASKGMTLKTIGALLGAILIGMSGAGADATNAAIALAQGAAIQGQIDFTRENEYEADRVGIATLYQAGFDPEGMVSFFEKMQQRSRIYSDIIPEYLSTHPLSISRITEARNRARQLDGAPYRENRSYEFMRARLYALTAEDEHGALAYFQPDEGQEQSDSQAYGEAIVLTRFGKPRKAERIFKRLMEKYDDIIALHIGLAEAQLAADRGSAAIATYEAALKLFPRNEPLINSYATALVQTDNPSKAHGIMVDLVTNKETDPENYRFLAFISNEADNNGDSHFYMSEYYLQLGEPFLAMDQLRLALKVDGLTEAQKSRFNARLDRLRDEATEPDRKRSNR